MPKPDNFLLNKMVLSGGQTSGIQLYMLHCWESCGFTVLHSLEFQIKPAKWCLQVLKSCSLFLYVWWFEKGWGRGYGGITKFIHLQRALSILIQIVWGPTPFALWKGPNQKVCRGLQSYYCCPAIIYSTCIVWRVQLLLFSTIEWDLISMFTTEAKDLPVSCI